MMSFFAPGPGDHGVESDAGVRQWTCEFCADTKQWGADGDPVCTNELCPGELVRCEVIVMHGSRNPDSVAYGPDETCENDAMPGWTVCEEHSYVVDEPAFLPGRRTI